MANLIATGGYSVKNVFDGDPAKNYKLYVDNTAIIKDNLTKTVFPPKVAISCMEASGFGDPIPFGGYFKIFKRTNSGMTRQEYDALHVQGLVDPDSMYVIGETANLLIEEYRSTSPESSIEHTVEYSADSTALYVYLYKDDAFSILLDIATVSITADGAKVKEVKVEYKIDTQGSNPPSTGWGTDIPNPAPGKFLWTKITTEFDDGTVSISYSVGGFGTSGINARAVQLSSPTTAIAYDELGKNPNLASVVITASSLNTEGTPHYEFIVNGATKQNAVGASYTYTVPTTFTGTTATIEVRLREGNTTSTVLAKDIITISQIKPGQDAYTVILSNESHTFPGSEDAAVAGSTSTRVMAYKGVVPAKTLVGTISGIPPKGMSVVVANNNSLITQLNISVTAELVVHGGELTIPVTVDGKSFEKKMTFSVSRKGVIGDPAYSISLSKESYVFAGGVTSALPGQNIAVEVTALKGTSAINVQVGAIAGLPAKGMTATRSTTAAASSVTIAIGVTDEMVTKSGSLTIPVTVDGKTFTRSFTYGLALQGAPGISITDVTEYYLATSAASGVLNTNTNFTTSIQTMTETNKYLWNYEEISYSSGPAKKTTAVIIGTYGSQGLPGRAVTGVQERYLATSLASGVTRDTPGFTDTPQVTDPVKKYLWNYEIISWSTGTTPTYAGPFIIGVHGEKGDDAYSINLSKESYVFAGGVTNALPGQDTTVVVTALKGSSAVNVQVGAISGLPAKGMTATRSTTAAASSVTITIGVTEEMITKSGSLIIPVTVDGKTFTRSFTYGLALQGTPGISITDVTEYYLATSAASGVLNTNTNFTTTIQAMTDTNKYLWNYEEISYSSGPAKKTTAVIIGIYGSQGLPGRAVTGVQERYLATNLASGVTRDTPGFTDTPQVTDPVKKYLWNYEIISWSSGTTPTYAGPFIIGVHGEKGDDAYTVSLSKESYVFAGGVTNAIGDEAVFIDITALKGDVAVVPTIGTISGIVPGLTTSVTTPAPNPESKRVVKVTVTSDMNTKSGSLTIPVTVGGKTFLRNFTYALALSGVSVTSVDVQYYLSTLSTSLVGGSWSTTAPTWVDGKFMWSKTITYYSDGTSTPSNPICLTGAKGGGGSTGRGIKSITEQYALSTDKDTAPVQGSADWKNAPPTWKPQHYMWTRSMIVFLNSNGTETTEYVGVSVDTSWEAVNEIVVGGRNLIKRSDFGNIVPSGVSGVAVLDEDYQNGLKATGGNNGRNNYIEFPDVLSGNGWYTVSFLARGTQNGTRGLSVIIGDSPSITDGRISNSSNEYTYHTYSYKVENYNSETNNSIKIAELDYAYYRIDNIKLEKGNVATDWTPAPEDVQAEIDNKVGKSVSEVFDALTNGGTHQGFFMDAGKVYINGEYIRADTLAAIKADLGTVTAGRIQSADNSSYWDLTSGLINLKVNTLNIGSFPVATQKNVTDATKDKVDNTVTSVFNALTAGGTHQGFFIENGKVYINGEYIRADTLAAIKADLGTVTAGRIQSTNNSSYWDLTTGVINLKVNTLTIGSYAAATTQTVSTAVSGKVDNTQLAVFNALTANQTKQGIYLDAGKVYINGEMIKSRSIGAESISADAIDATVMSAVKGKFGSVGGNNLIYKSNIPISNSAYLMKEYDLAEDWELNTEYTVTVRGTLGGTGTRQFGVWLNGGSTRGGVSAAHRNGETIISFTTPASIITAKAKTLNLYNYPSTGVGASTVEWIKLEKGPISTGYSQHPSEFAAGVVDIDNTGVHVSEQGKSINTNIQHDGLTIKDGTADIAQFGDIGAKMREADIEVLKTPDAVLNYSNTSGKRYSVGYNKEYANISAVFMDIFGVTEQVNARNEFRTHLVNDPNISIDVFTDIQDDVRLWGIHGSGRIYIWFHNGSTMDGSFSFQDNTCRIYIRQATGQPRGKIKDSRNNWATIAVLNSAFLMLIGIDVDANGNDYGIGGNDGGVTVLQDFDCSGATIAAVRAFSGHTVRAFNSRGNAPKGYIAQNGGAVYLTGTTIRGASMHHHAILGHVIEQGTLIPTDSAFIKPPLTNKVFTYEIPVKSLETYNYTQQFISTYYGNNAAQGFYKGMSGWLEGRVTFGTNVASKFAGGSNIKTYLKLRRKSSGGDSAAVKPKPFGFSATWSSGATMGGWTSYAAVSSSLFSASSDSTLKFRGTVTNSDYAIWESAMVKVEVTKRV